MSYNYAKALRAFLKQNIDRIELMYLPAYSFDFNSIVKVWWYMRENIEWQIC